MTSLSAVKHCLLLLCLTSIASAQAFKTVLQFDGNQGGVPANNPVLGTDGNYYGTTTWGGNNNGNNFGTVFKITPSGKMTSLHTFCLQSGCPDGANPIGGLALGMDGNFYGTTSGLNCNSGLCATVFKITPQGQLTTLYTFCTQSGCPDGSEPLASLFLAADGNFYGTTADGGPENTGTIFKITPTGSLATVYAFAINDGQNPYAPVVQAPDGNFYGTTLTGGTYGPQDRCEENGCGTIFRMTPSGTVTYIHDFCQDHIACTDGAEPLSGLTVGNDGNLYGTNSSLEGTIYKTTTQGDLTTLYSFHGQGFTGLYPQGNLTLATDGNFYSTTAQGGTGNCRNAEGCGVVYQFTPGGVLTVLHNFQGTDGSYPTGGVEETTRGYLIGTTSEGAIDACFNGLGCGTIFDFSMGLGPSVTFINNPGKVGQTVGILGQGLTRTTAVSFHGIPASFSVVSDTYITATLPSGATTGYVQVATTKGTIKSGRPYVVLP